MTSEAARFLLFNIALDNGLCPSVAPCSSREATLAEHPPEILKALFAKGALHWQGCAGCQDPELMAIGRLI